MVEQWWLARACVSRLTAQSLTHCSRRLLVVQINMVPRKVNPDYHKQITVLNQKNPAQDLLINIRGNTVDDNGVVFHSRFYNLTLPAVAASSSRACINLGSVIVHHPAISSFVVSNVTDSNLVLQLSSSDPTETTLYRVCTNSSTLLGANTAQAVSELHSELGRLISMSFAARARSSPAHLLSLQAFWGSSHFSPCFLPQVWPLVFVAAGGAEVRQGFDSVAAATGRAAEFASRGQTSFSFCL